jgi:hypothetical protein
LNKGILNVNLVTLKILGCNNGEKESHSAGANNRCKDFIIVNAISLSESFEHKPRLVPLDRAVSMQLALEHPLARECCAARW